MVKIQINAQGKALADGGKILKAQSTDKYGMEVGLFVNGSVDSNGKYTLDNNVYDVVISGIRDIGERGMNLMLGVEYTSTPSKKINSIEFKDLESCTGASALSQFCNNNTNLTRVSFPKLELISGTPYTAYSFDRAFYGCSNLAEINFPKLKRCYGSYDMQNAFARTSIEEVSFPSLESLGQYSMTSSFSSCSRLKTVNFPSLNSLFVYSLNSAFNGCTSLENIYFNSLTSASFRNTTCFDRMLSSTGSSVVHTVHFPSNLESIISTLSGYPLFGGSSGSVVLSFDLPATE